MAYGHERLNQTIENPVLHKVLNSGLPEIYPLH